MVEAALTENDNNSLINNNVIRRDSGKGDQVRAAVFSVTLQHTFCCRLQTDNFGQTRTIMAPICCYRRINSFVSYTRGCCRTQVVRTPSPPINQRLTDNLSASPLTVLAHFWRTSAACYTAQPGRDAPPRPTGPGPDDTPAAQKRPANWSCSAPTGGATRPRKPTAGGVPQGHSGRPRHGRRLPPILA